MNYEFTVSFDRAVDVLRTLERANIEFRRIPSGELIALYGGEVVRLEPIDGELSAACDVSGCFFQTTTSTPDDWPMLARQLRTELVDRPVSASNTSRRSLADVDGSPAP